MNIAGLQKLTLLDYPGKTACTVFCYGCNFLCPFCHNAALVLPERIAPQMTDTELLTFLEGRRKKLDGVCITGGEPTLYSDLPQLIEAIRELGFQVKLDTNGTQPQVLRDLIRKDLLDYVAMDIKNAPSKYFRTCGDRDVLRQVQESAALLMESHVEYEFRTTAFHPFHTPEDMAEIGQWLQGAKRYFIQQFVDSGDLVGTGTALSPQEMAALKDAVIPFIPNTQLRGL